jgi:hypothetical protein
MLIVEKMMRYLFWLNQVEIRCFYKTIKFSLSNCAQVLYGAVEETTVSNTVVNTLCISPSLPATRYTEGESLAQHIVVEEGLLYSCCLCRDFTSRHRPLIEEHLRKFCRKRQPLRVTGGEAQQVGLIMHCKAVEWSEYVRYQAVRVRLIYF